MKYLFFIFLSICVFIETGFSQVGENTGSRILFQGLVMDASDLSPIANSQILINRSYYSISESDGTFAFYVNRNDTVVFSSLGYKSTIMHVSDTLAGTDFIAGIFLKSDTISISEVIIVPRLSTIKSDMLNPSRNTPTIIENARYNVAVSAYQGRTSQNILGDPATNYEILRQQQKVDAYERGGIPSDRIVGLSPFMLLPAAYLLINGLPPKPSPFKPQLTNQEIDQIHEKYIEKLKLNK